MWNFGSIYYVYSIFLYIFWPVGLGWDLPTRFSPYAKSRQKSSSEITTGEDPFPNALRTLYPLCWRDAERFFGSRHDCKTTGTEKPDRGCSHLHSSWLTIYALSLLWLPYGAPLSARKIVRRFPLSLWSVDDWLLAYLLVEFFRCLVSCLVACWSHGLMKPISALCPRWSERRRSNWVEKNHRERKNCWHFERLMELSNSISEEFREISPLTWLWPLERWRIYREKVNPKAAWSSWSPIPSWCWVSCTYISCMFCSGFSTVPAKKLTGEAMPTFDPKGINASPQAKIDPVQHLRITALGNAIDVAATVAVGGPGRMQIRRPNRWRWHQRRRTTVVGCKLVIQEAIDLAESHYMYMWHIGGLYEGNPREKTYFSGFRHYRYPRVIQHSLLGKHKCRML